MTKISMTCESPRAGFGPPSAASPTPCRCGAHACGQSWGWVADALGAVRDLEVQREQLEVWIVKAEESDREPLSSLDGLLEKERVPQQVEQHHRSERIPVAVDSAVGRLVYLYVGSDNVTVDVGFYRDHLGGEVVWHHRALGAEVAAVHLGDGPLVLLADHRRAGSVLPIWVVEDIDVTLDALKETGWTGPTNRVEVPDGPCLLLTDPSGNEIGLLHQSRPGVMEHR